MLRGFQDFYLYSDGEHDALEDASDDSTSGDAMDDDDVNISGKEIDQLMAAADTDGRYAVEGESNQAKGLPSKAVDASDMPRKEDEYETNEAFEDVDPRWKQMWQDAKARPIPAWKFAPIKG